MSCLCGVSSLLLCEAEIGMSGSAADPVSFMWADQTLCHKQSWDQFKRKRILNCWCFVIGFFLIKKKKNWLAENWLQWMKGLMSFFSALLDLYEPENSSLISQSIYVAILLIKTHYMYLILHLYLTIKCLQNAPCCFQIWEFPLLSLSDDLRCWLSVSGLSSSRFISGVRLLRFRSSLIHL